MLVVCLGGDVHVVMNEQTHTANSVDSHPSTVPVTTLHISCSTSDHHFGFCDSQLLSVHRSRSAQRKQHAVPGHVTMTQRGSQGGWGNAAAFVAAATLAVSMALRSRRRRQRSRASKELRRVTAPAASCPNCASKLGPILKGAIDAAQQQPCTEQQGCCSGDPQCRQWVCGDFVVDSCKRRLLQHMATIHGSLLETCVKAGDTRACCLPCAHVWVGVSCGVQVLVPPPRPMPRRVPFVEELVRCVWSVRGWSRSSRCDRSVQERPAIPRAGG